MTAASLVLASGSNIRRAILQSAGVEFEVIKSSVDEDAIKRDSPSLLPAQIACVLGAAKACDVSSQYPNRLVLGADQTMEMDGQLFDKLSDRKYARERLLAMRGKAHSLHSGLALARSGSVVWELSLSSTLYVREFSDEFLDYYLDRAGDELTASVGAYAYEGLGSQLFDRVEGDYFAILGLPLVPLLTALRDQEVLV
jgi:septum formation protein